ncbi:MAG: putative glycosyl transferase [Frankiales bacterium]|nr:putative glycosyl transferase [Frankiales bacterium]
MSTAAGVRALARDVVAATRGHDLALYAAGVVFYAAIGFVPLLLLALYLAGLIAGESTVRMLADGLAGLLPNQLGAADAGRFLASAGTSLGGPRALVALVPASLYGEGLVRAFDRLSDAGEPGRRSLRGRLGSLLLVAASPFLLLAGLAATRGLTASLGDGLGARVLGVYVAFVVGWLSISVLLVLTYRGIAPDRCGPRALLWGAFSTGSFLSGTSLGFVLFLSLGIDLGGAYGGSSVLATGAVALGWLLVLHVVVLVGYVLTLRLEARGGHPLRVPTGPDLVRDAA